MEQASHELTPQGISMSSSTADFINAETSYNGLLASQHLKNQIQVYPDAIIVEYHFSGFDPQYGGMDKQACGWPLKSLTPWYAGNPQSVDDLRELSANASSTSSAVFVIIGQQVRHSAPPGRWSSRIRTNPRAIAQC